MSVLLRCEQLSPADRFAWLGDQRIDELPGGGFDHEAGGLAGALVADDLAAGRVMSEVAEAQHWVVHESHVHIHAVAQHWTIFCGGEPLFGGQSAAPVFLRPA